MGHLGPIIKNMQKGMQRKRNRNKGDRRTLPAYKKRIALHKSGGFDKNTQSQWAGASDCKGFAGYARITSYSIRSGAEWQ